MGNVKHYLDTEMSKTTFGQETDHPLSELKNAKRNRVVRNFKDFIKLNTYPVHEFYKAVCLFDSRRLQCISHDIDYCAAIKDL